LELQGIEHSPCQLNRSAVLWELEEKRGSFGLFDFPILGRLHPKIGINEITTGESPRNKIHAISARPR